MCVEGWHRRRRRRGAGIDRHSLASTLWGNLLRVQPPSCPSLGWQAAVPWLTPALTGGRCAIGRPVCRLPPEPFLCAPPSPRAPDAAFGGMSCPGRHDITALQASAPRAGVTDHERAEVWVSGPLGCLCRRWPVSEWNGKVTVPPSIWTAEYFLFPLKHFWRSPLSL